MTPLTKSAAVLLVNENKHLKRTSVVYQGVRKQIYDITIYPLDRLTNAAGKLHAIYSDLIHGMNSRKFEELDEFFADFEEDEDFTVKAVLISQSEVDNRFYQISYADLTDLA